MDSNMTGRFPRTYKDATGMEYASEDRDWVDKLVAWTITMGLAFVLGVLLGAATA